MKIIPLLFIFTLLMAAPALAAKHPELSVTDPLEIFAYNSDLIVVGKIVSTQMPVNLGVLVPGQEEPIDGTCDRYTVEISKVIKEEAGAAQPAPGAGPRSIHIIVPSQAQMTNMLRKDIVSVSGPLLECVAPLKPNNPCVIYLQDQGIQYDGSPQYLAILATPMNQPGDDAAAIRAADPDQWNWGKADHGAALILLPRPISVRAEPPSAQGERVVMTLPPAVICWVALRNVSRQPLAINLYPDDQLLSINATSTHNTKIELLAKDSARTGRPRTNADAMVLDPKQIIFISAAGAAQRPLTLSSPNLTMGPWQLTAAYESQRDDTIADVALWKGTLSSAPATVQVKPKPVPPPGQRIGG